MHNDNINIWMETECNYVYDFYDYSIQFKVQTFCYMENCKGISTRGEKGKAHHNDLLESPQ